MSKIDRFGGNLEAFASDALSGERTLFGEATSADDLTSQVTDKFKRGWAIVGPNDAPTLQDFNALGFTLSQLLAYLHQMGVAEWAATQEYQINSIAQFGGLLYKCKTANHVGAINPSLDAINWETATASDYVALTGNQTIAGVKTFSSSPVVPNATTAAQALAFGQVSTANAAPVKTALNASGDAPIYACRAWVNFNGTGTVAIRASGNVLGITDNGTGDYTVNFTTAMPDANYSLGGMQIGASTISMGGNLVLHGAFNTGPTLKTSTQCRVQTFVNSANNGKDDMENVSLHFFR